MPKLDPKIMIHTSNKNASMTGANWGMTLKRYAHSLNTLTKMNKPLAFLLTTLLPLTTASPIIAGLRGQQIANIDYCKEKNYKDCVFGVSRAANDCISLPENYPLLSVYFESTVKCQIFTDGNCGFSADATMRYVRLEEAAPDLSRHNDVIGGYFQSLRCAGGVPVYQVAADPVDAKKSDGIGVRVRWRWRWKVWVVVGGAVRLAMGDIL